MTHSDDITNRIVGNASQDSEDSNYDSPEERLNQLHSFYQLWTSTNEPPKELHEFFTKVFEPESKADAPAIADDNLHGLNKHHVYYSLQVLAARLTFATPKRVSDELRRLAQCLYSENITPIVFLDIDGVLNHGNEKDRIKTKSGVVCGESIKILNELCLRTGAKIVISSTWRKDDIPPEDSLRSAGLTAEVVGHTPVLNSCRGLEIEQWLKDNESVTGSKYYDFSNYVILDDDSDMLYNQRHNFLIIDGSVGLTESQAWHAEKILLRGI